MPILCKYSKLLKKELILPFSLNICLNCSEVNHIYIFIEHLFDNNIKQEIVFNFLSHQNPKIRHISIIYLMKFFSLDKTILKSDPYYKNRLLIIKKLDFDELNDFLNDQNDEILKFVLKELYLRYCVNKDIFEKNLFNDEICINGEKYENSEILSKLSRLILHQNYNIRILASKLIFTFVKNDELLYILDKKIESNIGGMIVYGLEDECNVVRRNTIITLYLIYNFLFNRIYLKKNEYCLKKLLSGFNFNYTHNRIKTQYIKNEELTLKKIKPEVKIKTSNKNLKKEKKIFKKKYKQLKLFLNKNKNNKNLNLLRKVKKYMYLFKQKSTINDKDCTNIKNIKINDNDLLKQKKNLYDETKNLFRYIKKHKQLKIFLENRTKNKKIKESKGKIQHIAKKKLKTDSFFKTQERTDILNIQSSTRLIKSKIIEYFINTLNDEDENVRHTAIYLFFNITKLQKFKLCDNYIKQICYNLVDENKCNSLDLYSVNILSHLKYKSAEILKYAIKKISCKLNIKDLVYYTYKIFKNNIDLIFTNFYKHSNFNHQERELFDKEYVVEILVNYILYEYKYIKTKTSCSKYFLFIDMLLERTQIIDVDISKKSEILLKENLKKFLNGEPFNNIYKMKNDVLDYYLFLKDLYKALLKNSKSKILQLNKKYQNVDFSDNILNDKKIFLAYIDSLNLLSITKNYK